MRRRAPRLLAATGLVGSLLLVATSCGSAESASPQSAAASSSSEAAVAPAATVRKRRLASFSSTASMRTKRSLAVASGVTRGGAPGSRDTALLEPEMSVESIDAVVLSGGSLFGLDAAGGVVDRLRSKGVGLKIGTARIPIAVQAIAFDLLNGGDGYDTVSFDNAFQGVILNLTSPSLSSNDAAGHLPSPIHRWFRSVAG